MDINQWANEWYNLENETEAANAAYQHCKTLENKLSSIFNAFAVWSAIYEENVDDTFSRLRELECDLTPVRFNIVNSMIDTLVSKLSVNKIRCRAVTSGGDWDLQRKGKKLTKFIDGLMSQVGVYDTAPEILKDKAVCGIAYLHPYYDEILEEIVLERVEPDHILVDPEEAQYHKPREMFRKESIHKAVLIEKFPDFENMILNARSMNSDMIEVYEGWHLPVKSDGSDGKHVIFIEQCMLFSEVYEDKTFPIIVSRWSNRRKSWFGKGLCELLTGVQAEINKTLRTLQVSLHICAVPKTFVSDGTIISKTYFNNDIGAVVSFSGPAPTPGQLAKTPPELMQHLDYLYGKAYELAGVSRLSAQGHKPSGLDAAVALREYRDIEDERFAVLQRAQDKLFVDIAKSFLAIVRGNPSVLVKIPGRDFLRTMSYKDVKVRDEEYSLEFFSTNALPRDPAGRLAMVQEMLQAGWLSQVDAMRLLDFPDVESYLDSQLAPSELIDMVIDQILDGEEYQAPDEYMNLTLAIPRFLNARSKALIDQAPDEVIDNLSAWIEQAKLLLEPPAPVAPEVPMGIPGPQPVSELMPIAPTAPTVTP